MARPRPHAPLLLGLVAAALVLGPRALSAATGPDLALISPTDGALVTGDAVTVTFGVRDFAIVPSQIPVSELGKRPDANRPGEGHVHLMLDLAPLVVWERGEPYTFTGVPAGEHQLMVELVNNDHSSLSPPVVRQVRLRTAPAAPRAGAGVTGHASAVLGAPVLLALAALAVTIAATTDRKRRRM